MENKRPNKKSRFSLFIKGVQNKPHFKQLFIFIFAIVIMGTYVLASTVISDTGITSGGDIDLNGNGLFNTSLITIKPDLGTTPTLILASGRGQGASGAINRSALWFFSTQDYNVSDDNNRPLAIETHHWGGIQPNHVSFYSPLTEAGTPRAIQWRWGENSTGILELGQLNRIQVAENWTGYNEDELNTGAGIESKDEEFIIYLDSNSDQGGSSEFFAIKRNSAISGGTYTFFTSELSNSFQGNLSVGKELEVGTSANPVNITLYSPNGTGYSCGVADGGVFSCV